MAKKRPTKKNANNRKYDLVIAKKNPILGERAITIFSKFGSDFELARAYCWTSWYYGRSLTFKIGHNKKSFAKKASLYSQKALELSKKTKNAWLIGWSHNAASIAVLASKGNRDSSCNLLQNQIKMGKKTRDNFLIVVGQFLFLLTNFTSFLTVEDPDENIKIYKNNIQTAREIIHRFKIINMRVWNSFYAAALSYMGLAQFEVDIKEKYGLLTKAVLFARKAVDHSQKWKIFDSPVVLNCLS